MKIAYVTETDIGFENGVLKKIAGQIRCWLKAGHEVKLFALSRSKIDWSGIADLSKEVLFSPRMRYSVFRFSNIVEKVIQWQPDMVYLRSMMYYPSHKKLLTLPVIVEINSKEVDEIKRSSRFWAQYCNMTRGRILHHVKGIVSVTNEIARDVEKYNRPIAVIPNGIDMENCPLLPAATNSVPHLIFIGSGNSFWYGMDKIIWLARYFREWHFDVIGGQGLDVSLPNLVCHGLLSYNEYIKLMAAADIALGSIAVHRAGTEEASTLKVREYLACGIPTIIGYQDTDFPNPVPFILQLPNTEKNVELYVHEIEEFVTRWKGRRLNRETVLHLDNGVKEKQRLLFFSKMIGK